MSIGSLVDATRAGDHLTGVEKLIEQAPADEEDEAVVRAAREGNLEVVRCLTDQHGAADAENHIENAALLLAAEKGHMEIVQHLGECGADVNTKDDDGYTALIWAATNGNMATVLFLAGQCGADVNAKTKYGYTALQAAVNIGRIDIVQCLARDFGADVNAKDYRGFTALIWAARNGHMDIVECLAGECGSNVYATDDEGCTALSWAAESGHETIVQYLASECAVDVNTTNHCGSTALSLAAKKGNMDIVCFLAAKCGADVNVKGKDGFTALMEAAQRGDMGVLRYLARDCSADVNARNCDGCTALLLATQSRHMDIVQCLASECGADVNVKNDNGYTALLWAARKGDLVIVQYLAQKCGADLNAKFNDGYTALLWAAERGKRATVRRLAECGADVDAKTKCGYTALSLAGKRSNVDLVQYLARECGADVNTTDEQGCTPLMCAAKKGQMDVVRCLVETCAADVNLKDNKGNTATWYAAAHGHYDVQSVLIPFILPDAQRHYMEHSSWSISPYELDLTTFHQNSNIGGDFRAKWLDADSVVKLFIPDASHSSFRTEVHSWQRLRHPNVIKMYGACDAGPCLKFFVCEYASKGSLLEHVKLSSPEKQTIWKYLHEAALGLEYLHERGIVHGDLRCSNILIGSDGIAKLSNFGLSAFTKRAPEGFSGIVRSMRWQAPEVLKGGLLSYESDIYSLGMCVLEAETGDKPWGDSDDHWVKHCKKEWAPEKENTYGPKCPSDRKLMQRMCCQDPRKRASLSSLVYGFERLASNESSNCAQPDCEPTCCFDAIEFGTGVEAWVKLKVAMEKCDNVQYCRLFDDLNKIWERLQEKPQNRTRFERFHALVSDFRQLVRMSPEQARILRLSSTRSTRTSIYAFKWRIRSLLTALGVAEETATEREVRWQEQRNDQIEQFMSGVSDTYLLLDVSRRKVDISENIGSRNGECFT